MEKAVKHSFNFFQYDALQRQSEIYIYTYIYLYICIYLLQSCHMICTMTVFLLHHLFHVQ